VRNNLNSEKQDNSSNRVENDKGEKEDFWKNMGIK
jgi:hypothetical protein